MSTMYYRNKRILITGGAGFIGSHLTESLVKAGALVTILDDLSTGNISYIDHLPNVTFIHGSITDASICLQATHDQEIVFHLAAMSSVPACSTQPELCNKVNVQGTYNLLRACVQSAVERFIFASSAAVYGNRDWCSEDAPRAPRSLYGYSKYLGEVYCNQFKTVYGLDTRILRYFNVFGERQRKNLAQAGVWAKFKEQLAANQPIIIYGDGSQTRDFVPVETIVEANLFIASIPHITQQVYNCASGNPISIKDLLSELKKLYPLYNQSIQYLPANAEDILHSHADISRYMSLYLNNPLSY